MKQYKFISTDTGSHKKYSRIFKISKKKLRNSSRHTI